MLSNPHTQFEPVKNGGYDWPDQPGAQTRFGPKIVWGAPPSGVIVSTTESGSTPLFG